MNIPKKIQITFNNPLDESNIDHLEVWWKLGEAGTYAQLDSDIAFVSGVEDYLIEDISANVADGVALYYQARSYNVGGDYTAISNYILVGGYLSPILILPEGTEGIPYYYKIPSDFFEFTPDSYSINSALGSGLSFNETDGIFSGTPAESVTFSGIAVTAYSGIYSATSNADDLVIAAEAASSYRLRFDTEGQSATFTNIELVAGDSFEFQFNWEKPAMGTHMYPFGSAVSGATDCWMRVSNGGGIWTSYYDSAAFTLYIDNVVQNNASVLEFAMDGNDRVMRVDVISLTTINVFRLGARGSEGNNVCFGLSIFDITFTQLGVETNYAINTGLTGIDGVTEDSTTPDTNVLTFHDTLAGNWEEFSSNDPQFISPLLLPYGVVGTHYSASVSDLLDPERDAPDSYTLNGSLPDGVSLNTTTGDIIGDATTEGVFSFSVTGNYASGSPALTDTEEVNIGAVVAGTYTAGTFSLPIATLGQPYEYLVSEDFSGTPTSYTLATGVLTDGLTLNQYTGMLSFTPTVEATMAGISITATNSLGSVTTDLSDLVITHHSVPVFAGTFAPTECITGVYYEYDASVFFTNATSYEIGVGKLPAGMWIHPDTGMIYGTRTVDETVNISVIGMNSLGTDESNIGEIT